MEYVTLVTILDTDEVGVEMIAGHVVFAGKLSNEAACVCAKQVVMVLPTHYVLDVKVVPVTK